MNCRNVTRLLSDYADGALPAHLTGAIARHVRTCASCAAEQASHDRTIQLLHGFENRRLPAGFNDRLARRLEVIPAHSARVKKGGAPSWRWLAALGAVTGAALATWRITPAGPPRAPVGHAYLDACVEAHRSFEVAAVPGAAAASLESGPDIEAALEK